MPSLYSIGSYGIKSNHHPISYMLKANGSWSKILLENEHNTFQKGIQKIQQFHHEGFFSPQGGTISSSF